MRHPAYPVPEDAFSMGTSPDISALPTPCQGAGRNVVRTKRALPVHSVAQAEGRCVDPRTAVSIARMSIFVIVIIASMARFAAASSCPFIASSKARGVICHEKPHRSLHQPHALSSPPLSTIAFQYRSVSAWSSVSTMKLTASFGTKFGPR